MPTPAEVIEKVFTTANPDTGSTPPPDMAWVVFEHGTVYFTTPDDRLELSANLDQVADAARAALDDIGPVVPATSSADFTVSRLDGWYPDDPVWFVGFDAESIAAIVVEDFDNDLAPGMTGRAIRDDDREALRIVSIRNFRGEQRSFTL